MELRKINTEDACAQWEYTTKQPADENGLTNEYNGVSLQEYIKEVLPKLISYEHPVNAPDWLVPETFFYLWDKGTIVGEFRIRHYLTDALRNGSGHIGYSIRKEYRGMGYGTKGLELTLKMASTIVPEDEIYLRLLKSNIPSRRVMEKNGAKITNEDEEHYFMRVNKDLFLKPTPKLSTVEYRHHDISYLDEALELAVEEYQRECSNNPQLPQTEYREQIKEELSNLFQQKYGIMAFSDGKLIGYISFYGPLENHCGKVKGAFSPFCGNAFGGSDDAIQNAFRANLASRMFEEVSKELIKDEVGNVAICRSAGDEQVNRMFSLLNFGIRCSDSIMRLSERTRIDIPESDIVFCEIRHEDIEMVRHLQEKLQLHLCSAPTYFPPLIDYFDTWKEDTDMRVFTAMDGERAVGFISITSEAETFVTKEVKMSNICGTYIEPAYRRDHIAEQLLEYICRTCEKEGYEYLGVDCETMNPTALRFWGKHFSNYTYSYVRRIDERCFGYLDYLKDNIWKYEEY